MNTSSYTADATTDFLTPTPAAFLDSVPLFRAGGLAIAAFTDTAKVDPVVVTETINTADKRKMTYSEAYVKVTDKFELQTAYVYKSTENEIDDGRMGESNSSGNATVKWIKIKKSDFTFTEGTCPLMTHCDEFRR